MKYLQRVIPFLFVWACSEPVGPAVDSLASLHREKHERQISNDTVFGPETFVIADERYQRFTREFEVDLEHYRGPFTVRVENGDEPGHNRVRVAWITLNGEKIFGPRDFRRWRWHRRKLVRKVRLDSASTLEVVIKGRPDKQFTLLIEGRLRAGRARIGPSGGVLRSDDGVVTVSVPPGAIGEPLILSAVADPTTAAPVLAGTRGTGASWRLQPDGLDASQPLLVELDYSSITDRISNPANLGVLHWTSHGLHSVESASNDISGQRLTFSVDHFSVFEIVESDTPWLRLNVRWVIPEVRWYFEPAAGPSLLEEAVILSSLAQWEDHTNAFRFVRSASDADANIIFEEAGVISDAQLLLCTVGAWFRSAAVGVACFDIPAMFFGDELDESNSVRVIQASDVISPGCLPDTLLCRAQTFRNVRHELGHALGIAHPRDDYPGDNGPVMIQGVDPRDDLHAWDIAPLVEHYGVRRIAGGTYRDRDFGIIGTAFLYTPGAVGGFTDSYDIQGPAGWNGGNNFTCYGSQPAGAAPSRAFCWDVNVSPRSGGFTARAAAQTGTDAVFTVIETNTLTPPTITGVTEGAGSATITWDAASDAKSFLVRVNPLPFEGTITGEFVVSGETRSATLNGLTLIPGASYQAVVFGFSHDLTALTPPPVGQFNVGAHGVVFVGGQ